MKNRHRVRTTAALPLVIMLVIGVVALLRFANGSPDPDPIESPTPAPSSTVDDPMTAVDRTRATVRLDTEGLGRGQPDARSGRSPADGRIRSARGGPGSPVPQINVLNLSYIASRLPCHPPAADRTHSVIMLDRVDGQWRALDVLSD